jgi:anti-sigma factor RsiW
MTMNCQEARDVLWPPEEPRMVDGRVLEARRHLERCESCRDYFALDGALIQAFRSVPPVRAPAAARERIFDALARERTAQGGAPAARGERLGRYWGSRPILLLLAGMLVLSFASLAALVTRSFQEVDVRNPGWSSMDGGAFVEDFMRRAVQEEHIGTSDPAEAARFLTRELGIPLGLPVALPGFDLSGVEVCIVEGVRGAVVMYKQNGRVLYHYLVPRSRGAAQPPALSRATPPDWPGEPFPSVVIWGSEDIQQALVSDMAPDHLMEIARALTNQG